MKQKKTLQGGGRQGNLELLGFWDEMKHEEFGTSDYNKERLRHDQLPNGKLVSILRLKIMMDTRFKIF